MSIRRNTREIASRNSASAKTHQDARCLDSARWIPDASRQTSQAIRPIMLKPLLPALAMLPLLVACTTHDRVFYNNRPHKGTGLNRTVSPAADPALLPSEAPVSPAPPAGLMGEPAPLP